MATNPSSSTPRPITGPPAQVNTLMATMQAQRQAQWKHYNIDALTMNTKSLAINCPLYNGYLPLDSLPPRSTPESSPLLLLPPEILRLIVQNLSITPITQFRQLSASARSLIFENLLYVPIFLHVPAALRAIVATRIGAHISLLQLHVALTTPERTSCGKFGDFFNLWTGRRVCHACFVTSPRYPYHENARETHLLPMEVTLVKSTHELSATTLPLLPTDRSVPGLYGREIELQKKRVLLCLPSSAREYGIAQHGTFAVMTSFVSRKRSEFEAKQRLKWKNTDWVNGGIIIGASTPDFRDGDMGWDNPVRHMVVVRFPWVRRRRVGEPEGDGAVEIGGREGDLVVEWGVSCERCREKVGEEDEDERASNVRYSKGGLGLHLKRCRYLPCSRRKGVCSSVGLQEILPFCI